MSTTPNRDHYHYHEAPTSMLEPHTVGLRVGKNVETRTVLAKSWTEAQRLVTEHARKVYGANASVMVLRVTP